MTTRILLFLAVFVLMVSLAGPSIGQSPASAPLTPAQSQAEAAAAKALMQRVLAAKKNSFPSPSLFTNRSAALMGVLMFIPLAMVEAFSSMRQKKGNADKAAQDIDALSKKYNFNPPANGTKAQQDAAIARFEGQGRQFYADVIATFDKVMRDSAGKVKTSSSSDQSHSNQFPRDIHAYTFTPVSPTEVKISTNKPGGPPLEAKLENGVWRFDIGGLADLSKWMPGSKTNSSESAQASAPDEVPQMKAAETLFYPRDSSGESQDGSELLGFSDNYQWAVDDGILVERSGVTDNGRKMEVWLGKKADYYHILNTDLVAIRVHDQNYPRQDTFSDAVSGGDTDRVKELLAANPRLANTMTGMDTPLQKAVFYDHKEIVQLLLSHGAKVNAADDFGQTPLMDAAQFDHPDMAKLLLAAGAKVNLKNDNGETALSIAKKAHFTDMVALLKQHGAK